MKAIKGVLRLVPELTLWVVRGWHRAFQFSGRAYRREFWGFAGPHAFLLFAGTFADSYFFGLTRRGPVLSIVLLYLAFAALPLLAASVRRLHDTARSGWYLLWLLVPAVGTLLWVILMIEEDHHVDNSYGPDPFSSSKGSFSKGSSSRGLLEERALAEAYSPPRSPFFEKRRRRAKERVRARAYTGVPFGVSDARVLSETRGK